MSDAVINAVCADMQGRSGVGIRKYGTTLADNPAGRRERIQHAYEEACDLAAYLKWELMRMDEDDVAARKVVTGWAPTPKMRWLIPSASAYSVQPGCARLQQEWKRRLVDKDQTEWRDVPWAEGL